MDKKRHQRPRHERFDEIADKLEQLAAEPSPQDDPNWLRRMAHKWRARAIKRERGLEHKEAQTGRKFRG